MCLTDLEQAIFDDMPVKAVTTIRRNAYANDTERSAAAGRAGR